MAIFGVSAPIIGVTTAEVVIAAFGLFTTLLGLYVFGHAIRNCFYSPVETYRQELEKIRSASPQTEGVGNSKL